MEEYAMLIDMEKLIFFKRLILHELIYNFKTIWVITPTSIFIYTDKLILSVYGRWKVISTTKTISTPPPHPHFLFVCLLFWSCLAGLNLVPWQGKGRILTIGLPGNSSKTIFKKRTKLEVLHHLISKFTIKLQ